MREGFEQTGNIQQTSTGYLQLAAGSVAQRPTANNGMMRYNTDYGQFEFYSANTWSNAATLASVAASYLPLTGGNLSGNLIFTSGRVELAAGNATAPSLTFSSNLAAGVYYTAAANSISFTIDGANAMVIQANAATPSFVFSAQDGLSIPSGTTAQRPTVANAGTIRWNTTLTGTNTTGAWDTYDGAGWDTHAYVQIPGADAVLSESMHFVYDTTRSKYLTSSQQKSYYIAASVATNDYINWDSQFSTDFGDMMPYNGTITGFSVYVTNINKCIRSVSVYTGPASATENTGIYTFGSTTSTTSFQGSKTNVNLDFAAGDKIQVRMRFSSGTTGNAWTNMNLIMFYRWRL